MQFTNVVNLTYRSKHLLAIAQLNSWVVITPERQRRDTESFIDLIIKTGGGVGFRMRSPDLGMLKCLE